MGRHAKTVRMVEEAYKVLSKQHPMTLRQVYYRLVANQVISNNQGRYQALSNALRDARKEGVIPWAWMEDRTRRPRAVNMWSDLPAFVSEVPSWYHRDVWEDQLSYLEVWLEKDALSGTFADVLEPYRVTFQVGRGFDGWSSVHNASQRYRSLLFNEHKHTTLLYYGDFDPSGEDMARSLEVRINEGFVGYTNVRYVRDAYPTIIKRALTYEDIQTYDLPPDFVKSTDPRSKAHVAKWGDIAVELDALPDEVLRERLEADVRAHMDLGALQSTLEAESEDNARLREMLGVA